MPIPFETPNVPIVGQPKVLLYNPQVLLRCPCNSQERMQLIFLPGVKMNVACPGCGRIYAIDTAQMPEVTMSVPAPSPSTPQ